MKNMQSYLSGGDLRSTGRSNELVKLIKTQSDFDTLFRYLFSNQRLIVMRAADAVEKLSAKNPEWTGKHAADLIALLQNANDKELKWHLALICTRLKLDSAQVKSIWNILSKWALDKNESKIVRVNALQGLFEFASIYHSLQAQWVSMASKIGRENIPSLSARIRKLSSNLSE